MVDFRKLHEDWWNSLPPEQQERITEHKRLEEENTFYTTMTLLDDEYRMKKYGEEAKEEEQEVKLYRPIYSDNRVGDKILLSFGGYREYSFDQQFVTSMRQRLEDSPTRRFCIDAGNEVYVKREETLRIIEEALQSLQEKGISMTEDYHPTLSTGPMGDMLKSLGLR